MFSKFYVRLLQFIAGVIILIFAAGCDALTPEFTYQGRLTDENGSPLNGTFTITFKLFDALTGGTEIYTETEDVTVTDGLFEVAIGPTTSLGSLDPEVLSQPLYLQLTINDGVVTETLTPRQKLYGAPYAFTLMQGSVISGSLDTTVYGASEIDSVVTIQNTYDGDGSNPALPALWVSGDSGIVVADRTLVDGAGTILSNPDGIHSDLTISSNDVLRINLDADNNSSGEFSIFNGAGVKVYYITEAGSYVASGTKSTSVEVVDEQRLLYAIESPEVWFEDFGTGTLVNGEVEVVIDALFAETVNLTDYHVFLTPLGDCSGLFISEKTEKSFIVKELGGGTSNISFDFRIVAHRQGYETNRLELDSVQLNSEEE
ncbi:MAG: hypothetical protein CVU39_22390 [Chloroflexi bacterium HGW-Chloroflexi-10]|nr:MAG: hypothetical protein CVU39_22390 [Chloroflexi bacterium HGW-Chloroflexi-10]